MMLQIPDVLTPEQLQQCRQALKQAEWSDGRETAGHVAAKAKANLQLPLDHPVAQQIGQLILQQLAQNPTFIAAALPLKVLPPRFNRYEGGGTYGNHIDNAIFGIPGSGERVRSDISSTLFFSDPDEYDGGELIVEDSFGSHSVKLPAGHLIVYPGSSLHRVNPVTRGTRLASFFWTQSLIRDDHQRSMLWELDNGIQRVTQSVPDLEAILQLTGVYHNLIRQWSNT
ncbi:Fe2+-dependent dioxygenase [Pusillimonas sp. ANT_WB101]|uniref:Fe2+-dependent dioxygenase n=1 Tax=Pusillimonas sp. ANT_WB101 TaxID=2597356 RepID=UPI0011EBF1A6|nr:Fe2+-dependent dioxygenase [Pusillimonas sp. ANT_WB101]KAA0911738.1 Fe2+-dependent dioxygenase [Pusillimonas sp. ANT_WB101]